MATYIIWLVSALALVILELSTGTFYMLMLALALAAGGLLAWLGFGLPEQFAASAVAGMVGIFFLQRTRRARLTPTNPQSLDIGQRVQRIQWREDGSARASYRGAEWDVELERAELAGGAGPFYIKSLRGNTLVITDRKLT